MKTKWYQEFTLSPTELAGVLGKTLIEGAKLKAAGVLPDGSVELVYEAAERIKPLECREAHCNGATIAGLAGAHA